MSGVSRRCPRTRLGLSPSSHGLDVATTVPLIACVDRPAGTCWSNATRVFAYPRGQFILGQHSSRNGLDDFRRINFLCGQFASVQLQEHIDDGKRDALVTVGKAMVSRERIPVGCCEALKRWSGHGVTGLVLRPAESRFRYVT
jgi:hypothetical protein